MIDILRGWFWRYCARVFMGIFLGISLWWYFIDFIFILVFFLVMRGWGWGVRRFIMYGALGWGKYELDKVCFWGVFSLMGEVVLGVNKYVLR